MAAADASYRRMILSLSVLKNSNMQNMVPVLDGPVDGVPPVSSQQQLQEQEKRIEISCALAAEASRRSRLLSARCMSTQAQAWVAAKFDRASF
ncbi:hypothetical protein WMY93_011894 [Mugilogobius chulae]|uniref:Uncharacterized protein n=1 Tax=Mugilogobius chulae TaxID=88201 RepID=A0AAW0PG24_9GOBI